MLSTLAYSMMGLQKSISPAPPTPPMPIPKLTPYTPPFPERAAPQRPATDAFSSGVLDRTKFIQIGLWQICPFYQINLNTLTEDTLIGPNSMHEIEKSIIEEFLGKIYDLGNNRYRVFDRDDFVFGLETYRQFEYVKNEKMRTNVRLNALINNTPPHMLFYICLVLGFGLSQDVPYDDKTHVMLYNACYSQGINDEIFSNIKWSIFEALDFCVSTHGRHAPMQSGTEAEHNNLVRMSNFYDVFGAESVGSPRKKLKFSRA